MRNKLRGTDFIKSLKNHFFKYVAIPSNDDECMEWLGYINPSGYGKLMHNFKSYRAHRLAYAIWKGEIPKKNEVCHSCDNTKCINPDHLFLGSHAENMRDMVNKNRGVNLIGSKHPNSKLKESDIPQIRLFIKHGVYQRDIARIFGVHQTVIRDINLKKTWRHVI